MTRTHTRIDSPVGPLVLTARDGALTGLLYDRHPRPLDAHLLGTRDDRPFGPIVAQLQAYFEGDLTEFDVRYELAGTTFQREVWAALTTIAYGETASYRDIAEQIGKPSAVRAVGAANGQNPISIIVPCHRVIGADGSLTGYGGGIDAKRTLLAIESRQRSLALDLP